MKHEVDEDWLREVERLLHIPSLKTDRIGKRQKNILAHLEPVCLKASFVKMVDTPTPTVAEVYPINRDHLAVRIQRVLNTIVEKLKLMRRNYV